VEQEEAQLALDPVAGFPGLAARRRTEIRMSPRCRSPPPSPAAAPRSPANESTSVGRSLPRKSRLARRTSRSEAKRTPRAAAVPAASGASAATSRSSQGRRRRAAASGYRLGFWQDDLGSARRGRRRLAFPTPLPITRCDSPSGHAYEARAASMSAVSVRLSFSGSTLKLNPG